MAVSWLSLAALLLLGSPALPQSPPEVEEEIIQVKKVSQLGGWYDLSPEGSDAQRMAEFAELKFGEEDAQCRYQTTEIQHAEAQVVNGINYRLKLAMKKTGCDEEVVLCDIRIFEDKRGNTKTIQEKNCSPASK